MYEKPKHNGTRGVNNRLHATWLQIRTKGTHTVYFSIYFYSVNQKPMIPRTVPYSSWKARKIYFYTRKFLSTSYNQ